MAIIRHISNETSFSHLRSCLNTTKSKQTKREILQPALPFYNPSPWCAEEEGCHSFHTGLGSLVRSCLNNLSSSLSSFISRLPALHSVLQLVFFFFLFMILSTSAHKSSQA